MQDLQVGLPAEPGGGRDHADGRAARQHAGRDQAIDQPAVADEVDALDPGCAVGDAGAREQRVHGSAALVHGGIDRRLVGEVELDGLHARQGHRGAIHHDDLRARILRELGHRRAHAGGAADDQCSLAVVPECVEQRH